MWIRVIVFLVGLYSCTGIITVSLADAHRSVCHRWHSCPSDSGSYICGDRGYCSQCPDNQYCQGGNPRKTDELPPEPTQNQKPLETLSPLWEIEEIPIKEPIPKRPKKVKKGVPYYRDRVCLKWKGTEKYVLDDGATVDCLTDEYAFEFDYSNKWAKALGLSLYYSMKTGKKPGILLIMDESSSQDHLEKLQKVVKQFRLDVKIWIYKAQHKTNE